MKNIIILFLCILSIDSLFSPIDQYYSARKYRELAVNARSSVNEKNNYQLAYLTLKQIQYWYCYSNEFMYDEMMVIHDGFLFISMKPYVYNNRLSIDYTESLFLELCIVAYYVKKYEEGLNACCIITGGTDREKVKFATQNIIYYFQKLKIKNCNFNQTNVCYNINKTHLLI